MGGGMDSKNGLGWKYQEKQLAKAIILSEVHSIGLWGVKRIRYTVDMSQNKKNR
jgi:hypothetical protein